MTNSQSRQTRVSDRNDTTRTNPINTNIRQAFLQLEPENDIEGSEIRLLTEFLCADYLADEQGYPSQQITQKASLITKFQNHPEIVAHLFGLLVDPLQNQIEDSLSDLLTLSPGLQYPSYPSPQKLDALDLPSIPQPFWPQDIIDTSEQEDTSYERAVLEVSTSLDPIQHQHPPLYSIPEIESYPLSELFREEEDQSQTLPYDPILYFYPETFNTSCTTTTTTAVAAVTLEEEKTLKRQRLQ